MHDSREGGSLQGRIPSTRLEPSANSLSLQLSTQQHDTQQKEKHLGEHPSQSRLTRRGDDPRASGNNDSGLERHCELRNTVGALSAVAKATNSRFAEVHMVGEVAAGHGFNVRGGLFCELKFVAGSEWTPLCKDALEPQQTQTAYGNPADVYVWSHPIDLHYALSSVVGWPSCIFCVWELDSKGNASPLAFGSTCLPMSVGEHEVVCHTWSPVGAAGEELAGRMFGRQELLGEAAWPSTGDPEKTQLVTRTSGRVLLRLGVATRYFDVHGISNGSVGISSGLAVAEQEARLSQHLLECKQIFAAYLKAAECDNKHPPVS